MINFIKVDGYFGVLLFWFLDNMAVWLVLQAADVLILFVKLRVKQAVCIFSARFFWYMVFTSCWSEPVGVTL